MCFRASVVLLGVSFLTLLGSQRYSLNSLLIFPSLEQRSPPGSVDPAERSAQSQRGSGERLTAWRTSAEGLPLPACASLSGRAWGCSEAPSDARERQTGGPGAPAHSSLSLRPLLLAAPALPG